MPKPWQQWYPHYIDRWTGSSDVQSFTDLEYRAVHNLMQAIWQTEECALPIDDKQLAKQSRVFGRWPKCREEVLRYFDRTPDGRLTHPVLIQEFLKARDKYEHNKEFRSRAGKKGNESRWKKVADESQTDRKCDTDASQNIATGTGTGTGTGTEKQEPKTKAQAPFVLPEWMDREAWDGYEEMRKKSRKPMTDLARSLAVKKLAKLADRGQSPTDVLNQSTLNAWTGLFEVKGNGNGSNQQNRHRDRIDAAIYELRRSGVDIPYGVPEESTPEVRAGAGGCDAGGDAGLVLEGIV